MRTNPIQARLGAGLGAILALSLCAPSAGLAQPPPGPPPSDYGPPPGYTGQDPALTPPPGYTAQDAQRDSSAQARDQDRAYAAYAERWAAENCIRRQESNAAAGTIIGGILGAVIGSNVARGGGRTGGAIIGGVAGAAAGNALARNASGGSCPQGFALRGGAPPFAPPVTVVYGAPGWYNPWIWYDGRWMYRPYPYHRYWRGHWR